MQVIDLSMTIHCDMEVYPGDPQVKIEVLHTYKSHGWKLSNIMMSTHSASHVDAFSHMHKDMGSLDEISLDRFFGRAQLVSKSDVFEKNIGLLFNEDIDLSLLDKILAASPNFIGGNLSEDLEKALLKNKIVTYTNLINLDKLPKNEAFMFYGLPLKIKDGDGSPVRAIAIID